jgi:cytochrome c-type biogenesis protein CcmH/NrfG
MKGNRTRLLARKRDVIEALHVLEQDRADGLVDEDTYAVAKQRYEQEVGQVLAELDALGEGNEPTPGRSSAVTGSRSGWRLLAVAATILCVAGVLAFLITAVHHRVPGETITGAVGQGESAPSGQTALTLQQAQQAVYRHPRSYEALVNLGTAYLQNGRVMEADLSYQAAMRTDPKRAAAPTFHAMLLGAVKRYAQALALLSKVERDHPTYARAWLMDGVLSSHVRTGRTRAIRAWLRFLLLAPDSDLAPKVRHWIVQLQRGRK